jgi:hypothetical protein
MFTKDWHKKKELIPIALLVLDNHLEQGGWEAGVELVSIDALSLKKLLYGLSELAKKGLALRAGVEDVLTVETYKDYAIRLEKLDKVAKIYDGEK